MEDHSSGFRMESLRPGGVLVSYRPFEAHVFKFRPFEVRHVKVRPGEVRVGEVRPFEVHPCFDPVAVDLHGNHVMGRPTALPERLETVVRSFRSQALQLRVPKAVKLLESHFLLIDRNKTLAPGGVRTD